MLDLHKDGVYPKELSENLRWRRAIRGAADNDVKLCRQLIERCRNDILFFLNAFCFLLEPRVKNIEGKEPPTIIPFATWAHQDEFILEFERAVNEQYWVGVEKSRGEGATWMVLMVFLHQWLFREHTVSFGLVSRNEQVADNPEDPNSLGWKVDMVLSHLPRWMVHLEKGEPKQLAPSTRFHRSVRNHTWSNRNTGSTITAYTTTSDLARGGRNTAFFCDEFASFKVKDSFLVMSSLVEVTDCVIMASTPNGEQGAFYKAVKEEGTLIKLVVIHWTANETRNRGLYEIADGIPVAVDPENNPLPEGYVELFLEKYRTPLLNRGFDIEKGYRSPWYDRKCLTPGLSPKYIAQQYDLDYGGSKSKVFPIAVLERLQSEAKPPLLQGKITFNHDDLKPNWLEHQDGHLLLWIELTPADCPPQGIRYIVGADVSLGNAGTSGSNSALSIVERDTGVKVAEFAHPGQSPELFAMQTIAICKWFNEAHLIYEDNGPGKTFGNNVIQHGYNNLYFRIQEDRVTKVKTNKPGYTTQRKNKGPLLSEYAYALSTGSFVNPSHVALEEAKGYELFASGKIVHVASLDADPSGAGENHGDRTIADALACHVLMENPPERRAKSNKLDLSKAPETSMAHRTHLAREAARLAKEDFWLPRENVSLARLKAYGVR